MTGNLTFWTTGENMTRITRDIWEEGNCNHAMKVAEESFSMPRDLAIKLCTGKMMLIGDTREGDHTLDLTEDETGYKGKSIESLFTSFKSKYIELQTGKIEYDFNLRRNMIRGLDEGSGQTIYEVEREVRGLGINLEKKKFELIKQISFLCEISDHTFGEIEDELYSEINSQGVRLQEETLLETAAGGMPTPDVEAWVSKRIEAENAPLKIGKAGDSNNGWITPTGKFYVCGYMEHRITAEKLAEDKIVKTDGGETQLEKLGWMKLTSNQFFMFEKEFPIPLRNFVIDHWTEKELKSIDLNGTTFKNIDDLSGYFESRYGRI